MGLLQPQGLYCKGRKLSYVRKRNHLDHHLDHSDNTLLVLPAVLLSTQARSSHLKQDRTSLSDNTRICSCELIEVSYTVRELTGKIFWKMRNGYYAAPFICYEKLLAVLERYNLPRQAKVTAVWIYSLSEQSLSCHYIAGPVNPAVFLMVAAQNLAVGNKLILSLPPMLNAITSQHINITPLVYYIWCLCLTNTLRYSMSNLNFLMRLKTGFRFQVFHVMLVFLSLCCIQQIWEMSFQVSGLV